MGWPFGELALSKELDELRDNIQEYFGALNEIRFGLQVAVPQKPPTLIFFEQMDEFNRLPMAGGLLDQPYILMRELKIVAEVRSVFLASLKAQQSQPQGG